MESALNNFADYLKTQKIAVYLFWFIMQKKNTFFVFRTAQSTHKLYAGCVTGTCY